MASLPEPRTPAGRAGLAALLATPRASVLAVDFDGTLAPIVTRPEQAVPLPRAIDTLRALAPMLGTCAIVSGRGALDVVALMRLDAGAGIEVLGHYGSERWSAGVLDSPPPDPGVEAARRALPALLRDVPPGVHVEDKTHALVVHTRPAADPAAALDALAPALVELARRCGLESVAGRYVLELRPPGVDKGLAVRRLAAGRSVVVYVGDDLGDLPAFDAVESLRRDGAMSGLTVASAGGDDAPRELAARADLVVDGPDGVAALLTAVVETIAAR